MNQHKNHDPQNTEPYRDFEHISDILPGVLDEIHQRQQERRDPLLAARSEVKQLEDAQARGEAVGDQLRAAKEQLIAQEEQVRKLQPPAE